MGERSADERFWSKVDRSGGESACWLWTAYRNPKGYGRFHTNGRCEYAPRWAYREAVGPIPEGHGVLHRCDNPPCVNPAHLFTGTNAENVTDRERKGRARHPEGDEHWSRRLPDMVTRGERVDSAKLTEAQVIQIRDRYSAGGVSQRQLAAEYGVTQPTIGFVVRRVWWKHI